MDLWFLSIFLDFKQVKISVLYLGFGLACLMVVLFCNQNLNVVCLKVL